MNSPALPQTNGNHIENPNTYGSAYVQAPNEINNASLNGPNINAIAYIKMTLLCPSVSIISTPIRNKTKDNTGGEVHKNDETSHVDVAKRKIKSVFWFSFSPFSFI